jgi:N-acetylmuramoyl-L-alanine amidase
VFLRSFIDEVTWVVQEFLERRRYAVLGVLALIASVAVIPVAMARSNLADIMDLRFGVNEAGVTRIVIDLSENADYRVATVLRDGKPVLDIDVAAKAITIPTAIIAGVETIGSGHGVGSADAYNYRLLGGADARLQMRQNLADTAIPTAVFMLKPKGSVDHYRLVIDLKPVRQSVFEANLGKAFGRLPVIDATANAPLAQAPQSPETQSVIENTTNAPKPLTRQTAGQDGREAPFGSSAEETRAAALAQTASMTAPLPRLKPDLSAGRYTIVIDPGHGGRDPGAVGSDGTLEKNITLIAAKELAKTLKRRGYHVILTRDSDKFLDRDKKKDLEKRIELARKSGADLFLSLHADGNESASVRGSSVYTLSDKGSDRLMRKVNSEGNFIIAGEDFSVHGNDVATVLIDIAENRTRGTSSLFANLLVEKLSNKVIMLNNTHREANYVVLLSPDVPAVLLELGFISNSSDEKNLRSKAWRRKSLGAVADAIDVYFDGLGPVKQASVAGGAQ